MTEPVLALVPSADPPPVDAAEFALLMGRLGGFEPRPVLAVAVSGGADSLALLLLADRWARVLGGHAVALTVDHRLRPASAAEAKRVAEWAEARGIAHETLIWDGPHPAGAIQAAARAARYRLLGEWCRHQGVLHLLTAHHQDDQAETLLLRLGRGSGLAGLAAMAPIAWERHGRLLRPLLDTPAARLRATLRAEGQGWIEDPSNRDPRFARARLRGGQPVLAAAGLAPHRLAETCRHLGRARAALEAVTDRLLVEAAAPHPAGFVRLDPAILARAEPEIRLRALASLIMAVGAEPYTPRFERLERLAAALPDGLAGGRTLGGCRILPRRGLILIQREAAAIAPEMALTPGGEALWDSRFLAFWHGPAEGAAGVTVGPLGQQGIIELGTIAPGLAAPHLPRTVWPTLPAFRRDGTLIAIPHLDWRHFERGTMDRVFEVTLRWQPGHPVCGRGFTVV